MPSKTPKSPEGSVHDIECTGPGHDGKGCQNAVPTWLPKKLTRNFAQRVVQRKFLCGYCAATTATDHDTRINLLSQQVSELAEKLEGVAEQPRTENTSIPQHVNDAVATDNMRQENLQKAIRITNIPELQDENLVEEVLKISRFLNIAVTAEDVEQAYRSGTRQPGREHPRSIVVVLRSVDLKIKFLLNKKKLQDSDDYSGIYIKGELTFLRWKLFYYLRDLNTTDTVYVKRGKIFATMKDKSTYPNDVCFESVKDLHKIGIDSIDYSVLGFTCSETD